MSSKWPPLMVEARKGILELEDKSEEPCVILTFVGQETLDAVKELLKRALNTWDDAPPEFKALADLIEHGRVLQDYGTEIRNKIN